jgi:hypothetical protein
VNRIVTRMAEAEPAKVVVVTEQVPGTIPSR